MSGVRSFVGLRLPSAFCELLGDARRALSDGDPRWAGEKWVAPENLHVTLKFLGDVDPEDLAPISSTLSEAIESHSVMTLPFGGLRPVPHRRNAKMIWAEFEDPDGACERLATDVETAVAAFGIPLDERAFRPHATLVRARRPRAIRAQALVEADDALASASAVSLGSATFFASTLTSDGPVYEEIASFELERA